MTQRDTLIARRRTVLSAALATAACLACARDGRAHPLGNENIEHISVLWIFPDRLEVDFLLLIAETPSMVVAEEMDTDGDGQDSLDEQKAWLADRAVAFQEQLLASVNNVPLQLRVVPEQADPETGKKPLLTRMIVKLPGFADMPTYQLLIRYVAAWPAPLGPGNHTITYQDNTYTRNLGLKRIVLERVPGVEVLPPHPPFWDDGPDPRMYEQYDPADLPQERTATASFRITEAAGTQSQPAAGIEDTSSSRPAARPRLTEPGFPSSVQGKYQKQADRLVALLKGRWGLLMIFTVTGLSFLWGGAHALMPGHAKTVVAAYLISQKGTYWHAVLLAIIVTITHTALVVILGLIWAYYQATNPELGPRLQLWLGFVSGLLVAGMGLTLLWRATTGRLARHHHDHGDHHHHNDDRSWFRKLFTHSHPHVPGHEHTHDHEHPNALDHQHPHDHGHEHPHTHEHDRAHAHDHAGEHAHHRHHDHDRDRHGHRTAESQPLTTRLVLVLGVTGGIVPCPTATIIMLLGIGANVVLGALYAVAVFSLGLALTLMMVGFLALSSRRFATRILSDAEHEDELSGPGRRLLLQIVPAASGLVVVALGLAITANYACYLRTGSALFSWMG